MANAVKVTLGPKGRNVVLQRESFQALGRDRRHVGMMTRENLYILGSWTGGSLNGTHFLGGGYQSWMLFPYIILTYFLGW